LAEPELKDPNRRKKLAALFLAVFIIKAVLYGMDPRPRFIMGDSASYIYTTLTGWIPPDRSFAYGFLLRPLALWPHSLTLLLVFQVAISGIAAWLIGFAMVRYFNARFGVASVAACVCAIEPLQLLSERFVLTEAVSTFLFAIYVCVALEYLRGGGLWALAVAQVMGLPLISMRMSFLPTVLIGSVLLPLLGPQARELLGYVRRGYSRERVLSVAKRAGVHLMIAIVVSQLCLYRYRRLNGKLSDLPPAYLYTDGVFFLCFWAPVIQATDFSDPALRSAIFDHISINLRDPLTRNSQCYVPGGLVPLLRSAVQAQHPNDLLALNRIAKETALSAITRDPVALVRLIAFTYASFFDTPYLRSSAEWDEGFHNPAPPEFQNQLLTYFHERYDESALYSFIQRYHQTALLWYQFLMVAPVLFAVLGFFASRKYLSQWIFLGLGALVFIGQAIVVTPGPVARYLTADAWLTLLMLPAVIVCLRQGRSTANVRAEQEMATL
jgi:hypothetical protein